MFSKKYFRWKEPKAFLRLSDAFERSRTRWWVPLGAAVGGSILPLMGWFSAHFTPGKSPPSWETAVPIALTFGVGVAYFLPWFNRLFPSDVRFRKKEIHRNRGSVNQRLPYRDYESFQWRVNSEFATLILKPRSPGQNLFIGVPLEISGEAVSAFLMERDLRHEEGVPQPGE